VKGATFQVALRIYKACKLSFWAERRISKSETLHGACPERDSSVTSFPQNDGKRGVQGDKW